MILQYASVPKYCSCRTVDGRPKPLAVHQRAYEEGRIAGEEPAIILDRLKLTRTCCRMAMLSPPLYALLDTESQRISVDLPNDPAAKFISVERIKEILSGLHIKPFGRVPGLPVPEPVVAVKKKTIVRRVANAGAGTA